MFCEVPSEFPNLGGSDWFTIWGDLCRGSQFPRKGNISWYYLMFVSAIFIKFLFFHQMIDLQKLWKVLLISSKKLFSFSRYSIFCISVLPSFKVHDLINCLNKNPITHFIWYLENKKRYDIETLPIDGVSDKEYFYRKIMEKMSSKS